MRVHTIFYKLRNSLQRINVKRSSRLDGVRLEGVRLNGIRLDGGAVLPVRITVLFRLVWFAPKSYL